MNNCGLTITPRHILALQFVSDAISRAFLRLGVSRTLYLRNSEICFRLRGSCVVGCGEETAGGMTLVWGVHARVWGRGMSLCDGFISRSGVLSPAPLSKPAFLTPFTRIRFSSFRTPLPLSSSPMRSVASTSTIFSICYLRAYLAA